MHLFIDTMFMFLIWENVQNKHEIDLKYAYLKLIISFYNQFLHMLGKLEK